MSYQIKQSFIISNYDTDSSLTVGEDPDDMGCVAIFAQNTDPLYLSPEMAIIVAEVMIKVAKTMQEKPQK
jgi:hypothetical protein